MGLEESNRSYPYRPLVNTYTLNVIVLVFSAETGSLLFTHHLAALLHAASEPQPGAVGRFSMISTLFRKHILFATFLKCKLVASIKHSDDQELAH